MKTAIFRDPLFRLHSHGPAHPERAERLDAIDRAVKKFPHAEDLIEMAGRDATGEEISWVHDDDYIRRMADTAKRERTYIDPDTSPNSHSYPAAVRAAGTAIAATEALFSGACNSSFAFVRPPGHHAEYDRAMGFCLFNNIAIAAEYARRRHHLNRVLIVDWDVHHGNGTMKTFYDRESVLYASLHQYPHYPGTGTIDEIGRGHGRGYTLNVPLRAGMEDQEYLAVFRDILVPVALEYSPELVMISAGFDAHARDPLADMQLTDDAYARMTQALLDVAEKCCGGKVVVVLEGGYNLDALASGTTAVLTQLCGHGSRDWREGLQPAGGYISRIEKDVRACLCDYWRCLR